MIPDKPYIVNKVQYLIEVEEDKGETSITPQINSCKDKEHSVYTANPF